MKRDLHDERAIAFFGTWMLIGLHLDGWAHTANKPETFFSPWHFILYSGFGAAVAYFTFRGVVLKKQTEGDRLTTAGLVVFIAGAVGDGIWHEIFGIEVDLEALLSPTHLALMIGGLMMLGIAYRSSRRNDPPGAPADVSLIVTMTLGAALVMFFTQYFSTFAFRGLESSPGRDEFWEIHAIGSVFVTTAVLLGLTFLLVRRWHTPRFTFMLAYAVLATAHVAMEGRDGAWWQVPAAAVAGLLTDTLVRRVDPARSEVRARILSLAGPFVTTALWLLAVHVDRGMHWPAELWTGTIVLACLEGAGLGLLTFSSHDGAPAADEPTPTAVASP